VLSKGQIIEGIQLINRSARRDWLSAFDRGTLLQYLEHLQRTLEPRGAHSAWVRCGETPAVVTRRPAF
jgi:hypothetical protein